MAIVVLECHFKHFEGWARRILKFEVNLGYIMCSGLYSQTMLQKKRIILGGYILFCWFDLFFESES